MEGTIVGGGGELEREGRREGGGRRERRERSKERGTKEGWNFY